jgi:hypothetical protein
MNTAMPPRWAEIVLQLSVDRRDRDTVSGDLLEQYRDSVMTERGASAANAWYLRQVAGFVCRSHWMWAVAMSGAFLIRTAIDWRVPTTEFAARASVSSTIGIAILLAAGFHAAWRSQSIGAGVLAGLFTPVLAAAMSAAGAVILLAIWHDPATLAAIRGSGGIAEVFTLPVTLAVPGAVIGAVGGTAGRLVSPLRRA